MASSRPAAWVSPVLYGAVLLAGGYADLAGIASIRPAPFLGGIAVLSALDALELRRYPVATPPLPAAALLTARLVLFVLVAAADGSGMSRVLFLLLPFTAYFAFGRLVSIALGLGCAGLLAAGFTLRTPRWYEQAEPVSDLLMFSVGLVLTIAVAAVAVQEQRVRVRLEESHVELRLRGPGLRAVGRGRAYPGGPRHPRRPGAPPHRDRGAAGEGERLPGPGSGGGRPGGRRRLPVGAAGAGGCAALGAHPAGGGATVPADGRTGRPGTRGG